MSSILRHAPVDALPVAWSRSEPRSDAEMRNVVVENAVVVRLVEADGNRRLELDKYEIAKEQHQRRLRDHIKRLHKRELPENPDDWDERQRDAVYLYTGSSPESIFTELTGRGVKPLRSLEVLEELPGEESASLKAVRDVAETVVRLQQSGDNGQSPALQETMEMMGRQMEALQAIVARLETENASMREELDKRRGGRPRKAK